MLTACGGGSNDSPATQTPITGTTPTVSGSAGSQSDTTPTPNFKINSATSYSRQNTTEPTDVGTLLTTNGLSGYYFDARQYVDLDGDGVNEIIVAPGQDVTTASPVHIYKKQANGSYADATSSLISGTIPGQIHPRKVISADFNGDGLPDFYFVDHGYDHPPYPGAQNVLMLSNKVTGKLENKSITGNPTAFQHCATAGDIDNNGSLDIFVCAEGFQGADKGPYFLKNNGSGDMTVSRMGIPASISGSTNGLLASELVDVDNDGFLDLVTSVRSGTSNGNSFATTVFWGDGTGSFTDSRATILPNPASFVTTYDIKAEDIDGDGRRDLVLLRVTADLQGYYFQILRQTSDRIFVDESIPRIIKNASTWEGIGADFFPWIHMKDLNGDGKIDLAIGDGSKFIPARNFKWINDGTGVFNKLP